MRGAKSTVIRIFIDLKEKEVLPVQIRVIHTVIVLQCFCGLRFGFQS